MLSQRWFSRLDAGAASHSLWQPLLTSDVWNDLSDDLRQTILSFVLGDLTMCACLAAINRQSAMAVKSPNAWRDVVISIPRKATKSMKGLMEMSSSWKFASKAVLPAFPQRKVLEQHLQRQCPDLTLSVKGEGPVMLFVMTCRLRLGSMMQLHFFEPRYRYMCRHLTVGGRFGFMNGGRCSRGCTGVLCEVMELTMNSDDTYDALILAKSHFQLLEVWYELMPRGEPLDIAFIDIDPIAREGDIPARAPAAPRSRGWWRCLQGWRWLRCRR